jgi:hypothetical protein
MIKIISKSKSRNSPSKRSVHCNYGGTPPQMAISFPVSEVTVVRLSCNLFKFCPTYVYITFSNYVFMYENLKAMAK